MEHPLIGYLIGTGLLATVVLLDVNSKGILQRPLNDAPLKWMGNIATLFAISGFVAAFFVFEWWAPFSAFGASILFAPIFDRIFRKTDEFVIYAATFLLVGAISLVVSLFYG